MEEKPDWRKNQEADFSSKTVHNRSKMNANERSTVCLSLKKVDTWSCPLFGCQFWRVKNLLILVIKSNAEL
jgi:hypothetical protein